MLDWEFAGRLDLSGELGSTALSLAKGRFLHHFEPATFRSILDGYVAGGGTLPQPGPSWFLFTISGWLGHLQTNILRCLPGGEGKIGPDFQVCHEVVRDGVRGLPTMWDRLPELQELLLAR